MGAFDILMRWISPLTDPIKELRSHTDALNSNHANSLKQFMLALAPVAAGPNAMQSEEATKFFTDIQEYLNAERVFAGVAEATAEAGQVGTLTPPPSAVETPVLDAAGAAADTCATGVEGAAEVAAGEIGADAGLDAVTAAVDVADVAQGGLNIITDVIGIVLTIIDLALKVTIIATFLWAIYNLVQALIQTWNQLSHPTFPPLPQSANPGPTPVPTPAIVYPPGIAGNPEYERIYRTVSPGNAAFQSEIIALILAGYSDAEILNILAAMRATGGAGSIIFFISGSIDLNNGILPRLQFFWLPQGSWNGSTGYGLAKILAKHATGSPTRGSDLSCWGIGTRNNPIPLPQAVIDLLQAAVQLIADGEASRYPADPGNFGFILNPFKYNGGSCKLVIIFGGSGEIISAFQPKP